MLAGSGMRKRRPDNDDMAGAATSLEPHGSPRGSPGVDRSDSSQPRKMACSGVRRVPCRWDGNGDMTTELIALRSQAAAVASFTGVNGRLRTSGWSWLERKFAERFPGVTRASMHYRWKTLMVGLGHQRWCELHAGVDGPSRLPGQTWLHYLQARTGTCLFLRCRG